MSRRAAAPLVLLLISTVLLAGCSTAVRREAGTDRLYDPSLVGVWGGGESRWELGRAGAFDYSLTLTDPPRNGRAKPLAVDLVRIDRHLYLLPSGQDDLGAAASQVLIRLDRPAPGRLSIALLDAAKLADVLNLPPASPSAAATGPASPPATRPALPGLREALARYGGVEGLFVPLGELRRVR